MDGDQRESAQSSDDQRAGLGVTEPATERLKQLWRDVIDVRNASWPPQWLTLAFNLVYHAARLALILAAVAILRFIIVDLPRTGGARLVVAPVEAYIEANNTGIAVSSQDIMRGWWIAGVILFGLATTGSLGARVGWVVFGALTGAVTWESTHATSGLIPTGIVALSWSLLSIIAFRRLEYGLPTATGYYGSPRSYTGPIFKSLLKGKRESALDYPSGRPIGGSRAAEARGAAMQRAAEVRAQDLGHTDVSDYLRYHSTMSRRAIADELNVSRSFVDSIWDVYYPSHNGSRRGVPQQIKQMAVAQVRACQGTLKEVAAEYNVSPGTLSRWVKEFATTAEAVSTQPTSETKES